MFSIIYNIVITPIELIVEFVFELMFRVLGQRQTNQGLAVIGVSIAISFLTLPLYRRADAVQQKERDIQKKLSKWVSHIKKTFKGDERFMMLQTYYKENGYSPIQALNGSLSLLLEIPFFIAAYHFLSHLEVLNGASFGPITNLGAPDSLFSIGNFGINVLPIAMTIINCISSAIYLKGFPLRDKLQTYGMAIIFLVLLYNSPAGLVVYWTCNNIFGLIKNIFYKLKHPRKVFDILAASCGTLFTLVVILSGILNSKKKIIVIFLFMIITYVPLVLSLLSKKIKIHSNRISYFDKIQNSKAQFYITASFITVLVGLVIPSSVISSSPAEFVDIQHYQNPLRFIVFSLSCSIGFFILWAGVIYNIIQEKSKKIFTLIIYAASLISITNFLFFGRSFGILSPYLVYTDGMAFSKNEIFANLILLIFLVLVCIFTIKYSKQLKYIYLVLIISLFGVSIRNISHTQKLLSNMSYIKNNDASHYGKEKVISLSKNGKNVIVFMLDRAISGYIPYFIEEKPELNNLFSGFKYYPNTISFGKNTMNGAGPLFGGYEYTFEELNKRDDETYLQKRDEALKMLPYLFDKEGYEVTVCDPPFAGFKWIPDLSIFDDNKNIHKYITMGVFQNERLLGDKIIKNKLDNNKRNFFFYSLVKTLPSIIAENIYDEGHYYDSTYFEYNNASWNAMSVLSLLPELTEILNDNTNTFLSIDNDTTHEPCIYKLPDYEFTVGEIDNSGYTTAADGKIPMENSVQISHYHSNMAALLQLGKWFDWMKENDVYNNTRIIIVSDHGRELNQFDYMHFTNPELNLEWLNPLLLVKDFDANGDISTDNTFMTNADVPTLATEGIISNPVNPFTGKTISSDRKKESVVIIEGDLNEEKTEIKVIPYKTYLTVHDNIFDENNWERIEK